MGRLRARANIPSDRSVFRTVEGEQSEGIPIPAAKLRAGGADTVRDGTARRVRFGRRVGGGGGTVSCGASVRSAASGT